MPQFSRLFVEEWQQFARVEISFDKRLTVITGANGSGKTTLLRLLAMHRGWSATHIATPRQNRSTGIFSFFARIFGGVENVVDTAIGSITYDNGTRTKINVPKQVGSASYSLSLESAQTVNCIFVPSHRGVFRYEPLNQIPVAKKTEQNAFDEFYTVALQRHQGGGGLQATSYFMKSALIGWMINGYGVRRDDRKVLMSPDAGQREAFEGFQEILKRLLPSSLGFKEFEVRNMEIVFICNDGSDEFLLETASGGVATIIELAWQLFMFSRSNPGPFTVVIDEAENHLHPSLQRTLLPSLLDAFPGAVFIVSTHSPLIVSAVKDANVYVLRYNDDKKVVSEQLDLQRKARNASEILDEVLGVSSSFPIWVESEIEVILAELTAGGVKPDTFSRLRSRLKDAGLEHLLPRALADVAGKSE